MHDRIADYVASLFAGASDSRRIAELREEILQNTLDRYDEERAKGKSEQASYDAAVDAIGDISDLIGAHDPRRNGWLLALGVALYVLCVLPVIFCDALGLADGFGVGLMFLTASAATVLVLLSGRWGVTPRGRRRSLAIGLYVLCVIPPVLTDSFADGALGDALGVGGMFVLAAAATALMLLSLDRAVKPEEEPQLSVAEKLTRGAPQPKAERIFDIVVWSLAGVGCTVLLIFGQWYFAWLPFPMAAALCRTVRGICLLAAKKDGWRPLLHGVIAMFVLKTYWDLTRDTGAWLITWLVFPIGGCLGGVADGFYALVKGAKNHGEADR